MQNYTHFIVIKNKDNISLKGISSKFANIQQIELNIIEQNKKYAIIRYKGNNETRKVKENKALTIIHSLDSNKVNKLKTSNQKRDIYIKIESNVSKVYEEETSFNIGSCTQGMNSSKMLDFLPCKVITIRNKDSVLIARALLWKVDILDDTHFSSQLFADVFYTSSKSLIKPFKDFLCSIDAYHSKEVVKPLKHGCFVHATTKDEVVNNEVRVTLQKGKTFNDFINKPYFDTFRYGVDNNTLQMLETNVDFQSLESFDDKDFDFSFFDRSYIQHGENPFDDGIYF